MTQLSRGSLGMADSQGLGGLHYRWALSIGIRVASSRPSPSLGSNVLICSVKGLDSLRSTEVTRLRFQKPLQLIESI